MIITGARQIGKNRVRPGFRRQELRIRHLYTHMETLTPFSVRELQTMMGNFLDYMTLGGMPEAVRCSRKSGKHRQLYYHKQDSPALEMDFFMRDADSLVPVEVKAQDGATASLNKLIDWPSYEDIRYGVKFGYKKIGWNGKFYTFPLLPGIPVETLSSGDGAARISFPSQKRRHIKGQIDNAVLYLNIFRVQDIGRRQIRAEFLDTLLKRCKRIVCAALDFNGRNVMPRSHLLFLDQKINLHPVFRIIFGAVAIKKQVMSGTLEHLCDDVLHQHPFVDLQFVEHEFLIDFMGDDSPCTESQGDQKKELSYSRILASSLSAARTNFFSFFCNCPGIAS